MNKLERNYIENVLEGDLDSFANLIDIHQPRIRRIISLTLNSSSDIEDLIQHVFLKAYKNLSKFDFNRDFGAWVRGIAYNEVKMHLRSLYRKNKHLDSYRSYVEVLVENKENADEELDTLNSSLSKCRTKLPEKSDELINLKYVHGLSFQEIADVKKKSLEAIRKSISRVRSQLRECIKKSMVSV